MLEKYAELWDEIKNQIKTITGGEPILGIPSMIIVPRSVFQKANKYYPQVLLHECVYKFVSEL